MADRWLQHLAVVLGTLLGAGIAPGIGVLHAAPAPLVQVTDGDTLVVDGAKLRLIGIDAPEMAQTCGGADGGRWACGKEAKAVLQRLAGSDPKLVCSGDSRDRYGRQLVRCHGRFGDLGEVMVARGLAWAYRKYATDYVAAERRARQAGLGVWQGDHAAPQDFRAAAAGHPVAAVAGVAMAEPGACRIKGNISGNGWIYHLPGQRFYGRTQVAVGRGERWFCSEAEATAAGWRKAG